MAAMPVLKVLDREAGLQRLIASTYQAVSGVGLAGGEEFMGQVEARVKREEKKLRNESRKILELPNLLVSGL